MQDPREIASTTLMVTPWNLVRIRDLGRLYLAEARRCLSLMNEATDAHRQARQECKHEHRQSYEHFRLQALHLHSIACDLFLKETTLGQQAALVQLLKRYQAMGEQEPDPVCSLYEQAASKLCALLRASPAESRATMLIEHAMRQAQQALATRRRRKRSACELCKRGESIRCARGKALHRVMQGQNMYIRMQRAHLRPVFQMSEQDVRHLAAAHAAAISAAGDWHLHCFGGSTGS